MTKLRELAAGDLEAATSLVARCFPTDIGYRWALPLCALPERTAELRAGSGLSLTRQFVLADASGTIAGTFGLYAAPGGGNDGLVALNWFCVEPAHHGRGLGRLAWQHILAAAADAGGRRLIFYSSTEPHHLRAERLYLAAGCSRRLGPELGSDGHRLTFFDLPLAGTPRADAATTARIDHALQRLFAIDGDPALAALGDAALQSSRLAVAA